MKNKEPKFYDKNGNLTAYSFACGYVQTRETENKENYLKLWKDSFVYSVTGFINGVRIYESFDKLSGARKFFNSKDIKYIPE
jgi:hypothetical protein